MAGPRRASLPIICIRVHELSFTIIVFFYFVIRIRMLSEGWTCGYGHSIVSEYTLFLNGYVFLVVHGNRKKTHRAVILGYSAGLQV